MSILRFLSIALIGVMATSGCAGFPNSAVHNSMRPSEKTSQWNVFKRQSAEKAAAKKKKNAKDAPPESMVVIWKDAVLDKPGTTSVRGFGARIYFHDTKNDPVRVEGDLTIYGFDDSDKNDEKSSRTPSKKFVFTNEQLQSHFSESDLGPSYSVWIPWEPVGNYRKTVGLVPIFKTSDGKIINGGSSNNVLPGKTPENDNQFIATDKSRTLKSKEVVNLASHSFSNSEIKRANQAVYSEDDSSGSRIRTSTINLTPSMASLFSTPTELNSKPPIAAHEVRPDFNTFKATSVSKDLNVSKSMAEQTENRTIDSNPDLAKEASANSAMTASSATARKAAPVFGAPGAFR
jgi:hypothetical protein